mgnify:FL=1|tara:strand:+ start:272 stop:1387 length:1116 start_codon:yes stop_codon:yes gene_type:complete
MYINFWYPVCLTKELEDKPIKRKILGVDFVAFRDQKGTAHCLSNVCVHRGGSLADGKCIPENNSVSCPYHGWQYGGDGKCLTVPSLGPGAKVPARAKVDSYPVIEKYDIVFAFLGDLSEKERPELYEIEEVGAEGWRANETITIDINYNYERSVENGLDPAHNEFVHPTHGFSGIKNDYKVNPTKISETQWGADFSQIFDAPPLDKETYGETARDQSGELEVLGGYHGPNVLITQIHTKKETGWFHQYFFERPIDEFQTQIFFVNMRNWLMEESMDAMITERNLAIANEDITLLTNLRPFVTPPTMTKEILVPADAVIGQYRKTLEGFKNQGFKIDSKRFKAEGHQTAFAIPCPARRTEKNWVLDPIPLIQ